jgi:uncharacterized protein (DUF1800 family)
MKKFVSAPDQLRQRVTYALSQIFVMNPEGVSGEPNRFIWVADYMDDLEKGAFGNFRTLLEDVTYSSAMARYLTYAGSAKADGNGSQPDENYAREILQLFSIGLVELNLDGTPKLNANGQAIPTYTLDDIKGLARVFTGFTNQAITKANLAQDIIKPMVIDASKYETGEKKFLGLIIPAGTSAQNSVKQALDKIFNHPNVGPYIGRQLIQRLVASNPSPAYVERWLKCLTTMARMSVAI